MLATSASRSQTPSLVRWAGSKRLLLPRLSELIGADDRKYVEPFCGSASLFFELAPKRAQLSDSNQRLITALGWVRDDPIAVYNNMHDVANSPDAYYHIRERYNDGHYRDAAEAAAFLYLNRHCFNGLWRTNLKGAFNVPYGGLSAQPLSLEFLQHCANILRPAELKCADFRTALIGLNGKGLTIFADPPYSTTIRRTFREYGPDLFGPDSMLDLTSELKRLSAEGARVILSYCDDPVARQLLPDWKTETVKVTRNVGGFASRRRQADEVLIYNFEAA